MGPRAGRGSRPRRGAGRGRGSGRGRIVPGPGRGVVSGVVVCRCGGRFGRSPLVPVPEVGTLSELNARIDMADAADDARRVEGRIRTVGQDFAAEAPLLALLPDEGFEAGLLLTPRVDRFGRITVRQCHYSVPVRLIGGRVRVFLRASEVIVLDGPPAVCRHARSVTRGPQTLR